MKAVYTNSLLPSLSAALYYFPYNSVEFCAVASPLPRRLRNLLISASVCMEVAITRRLSHIGYPADTDYMVWRGEVLFIY